MGFCGFISGKELLNQGKGLSLDICSVEKPDKKIAFLRKIADNLPD